MDRDSIVNQFLTFTLDNELFAINVSKVREVLEYIPITKLPKTSEFMKGIINLRGAGVPVIDLRLKFGLTETVVAKNTGIIVMEVEGTEGPVIVGAIADAVHEVIELESSRIESAPKFGMRLAPEYVQGVGKKDDVFIIILDVDRIFSNNEVVLLKEQEAQAVHTEESSVYESLQ
jgi:purine-binding chemotaxis protein CheW